MRRRRTIIALVSVAVAATWIVALAWFFATPLDPWVARLDFALTRSARELAVKKILASAPAVDTNPLGSSLEWPVPLVADPLRQAMLDSRGKVAIDDMRGSRDLYFGFRTYHNDALGFVYVVTSGNRPHAPGWRKVESLGGQWFLVHGW